MIFGLSKYKFFSICISIILGLFVAYPLLAKRKPRPQNFGMLGFSGFLQPSWPKKPVKIKVAKIPKGSPAYGKLNEGDIIIGVGNEKFKMDPRPAMAFAIDDAEKESGEKLTLLLKSGKQVKIELPPLGSYSPTAPYNCPKTEKIITQTVKRLIHDIENPMRGKRKLKKYELTPTKTELLGLMATGEKKNIELAGKLIKESDMLDINPKQVDALLKGETGHSGLGLKSGVTTGWGWGYSLICLGEYYLLTKDESVLPAIRTFALGLARGQDAAGLWGHRMATARTNGRLAGYAQMNQNSLSNFMGMIIARKCGIKDPVLDKAIAKTQAYVESHIDKGGFPYGVHYPQPSYYNNNGMSGSAAINLSLLGNQHGAAYFSKLAAASHNELNRGHASSFFNPLWTPLGVNLSGPEITHEFFMKSLWYFNGKRDLEGGFPGNDKAGSFAGQALLTYCLPRKALLITGREADKSIWVKKTTARAIIALPEIDYAGKTEDDLIKLFNHAWSQVRIRAVNEIKKKLARAQHERHMARFNHISKKTISREEMDAIIKANPDENASTTEKIWQVIESGNKRERLTALMYFGNEGAKLQVEILLSYVDRIGAILRNKEEPLDIRMAAAETLGSGLYKEKAYPYYNDILNLVFEKPLDVPPFGEKNWKLSKAIVGTCSTPFKDKLVKDKDLFYKIALKFMDHKREQVRANGMRMLNDMPLEDFPIVADKLVYVVENKDPSYHSYHDPQQFAGPGIETMANLNIKDGLDILAEVVNSPVGKWGFKKKMVDGLLPKFGKGAIPYLPKFTTHKNIKKNADKQVKTWIKWIEQVGKDEKLISLEEAKKAGK